MCCKDFTRLFGIFFSVTGCSYQELLDSITNNPTVNITSNETRTKINEAISADEEAPVGLTLSGFGCIDSKKFVASVGLDPTQNFSLTCGDLGRFNNVTILYLRFNKLECEGKFFFDSIFLRHEKVTLAAKSFLLFYRQKVYKIQD